MIQPTPTTRRPGTDAAKQGERIVEDVLATLDASHAAPEGVPGLDEEAGFGALETDKGPLPLKSLAVRGEIVGLHYRLALRQVFVNTHDRNLEATYVFPLPERAAVSRFVLRVAGREVEGVLKERGAARREYAQALQAGHRAALAEVERPNVFTMKAGNIPPGEAAEVELALDGPLALERNEATFRFPLVVAPRYIPGMPIPGPVVGDGVAGDTDAVPDASRITPPVLLPGFPNPVRLAIELELDPAGLPFRGMQSSLHAVVTEKQPDGRLRVAVRPGARLDRDFILRFEVGDEALRTALVLRPDQAGAESGVLALTLTPPALDAARAKPRDLLFVLDRSGSMDGWKMVAARRSVMRMLDTLSERDRFDIFAFDDVLETFRGSLASGATRAEGSFWSMEAGARREEHLLPGQHAMRTRALEWLGKLDARGGTEMARPLVQAVERLAAETPPGRERVLVLVTDGQVGNERQILKELGAKLPHVRVFTLGVDMAPNDAFLRGLAEAGGGACEFVESEARLEEVMDRIHRKIGAPVLAGLTLEAEGFELEDGTLAPSRLPDLFAGCPVTIQGRYRGQPRGALVLRATEASGAAWQARVEGQVKDREVLAKTWARAHLRELLDRLAAGAPDPQALQRRILEASLTRGVLCPYTAFVAVDRAEKVKPAELHKVQQPVEQPAGWEIKRKAGGTHTLREAMVYLGIGEMKLRAVVDDNDLDSVPVEESSLRQQTSPSPATASESESIGACDITLMRDEDTADHTGIVVCDDIDLELPEGATSTQRQTQIGSGNAPSMLDGPAAPPPPPAVSVAPTAMRARVGSSIGPAVSRARAGTSPDGAKSSLGAAILVLVLIGLGLLAAIWFLWSLFVSPKPAPGVWSFPARAALSATAEPKRGVQDDAARNLPRPARFTRERGAMAASAVRS
ncbi:MAG: VIT domain-containing protein [Planctomycetota bacterium]|nr:VIT domain-containing protein [Planctomycetota bacterium]